ncbi:MAG: hypothetical protein KA035_03740 [Candidatus Levybacteria bacterium]|nr:hypothetical protein [Candidatus Levybacteria bacterium]
MRVFLILSAFFIFTSWFPQLILARDLTISANKNSLFGEEELVITASASGFGLDETIYIKGAFFEDGSSNYFGYTKNNTDWVKNSASSTSQRQVKLSEWDKSLVVKNDGFDTGYKGDKVYKFKVGFYYITSGGNISSVSWSTNVLDIALAYPTSTPTPQPTSTPAPTHTPVPVYTQAPSPTVRAVSFSPKSSVTKTTPTKTTTKMEVKGVQFENQDKMPTPIIATSDNSNGLVMPPLALLLGVSIIITGCGILLFREWKKQKEGGLDE